MPELVYAYGRVVGGRDVMNALIEHGGKNVHGYGGNDPGAMYYINDNEEIVSVLKDSNIGYILRNSGWDELKIKERKRTRKFMLTLKEGNNEFQSNEINEKQKRELADLLRGLLNEEKAFDGNTLEIIEM